MCTPALSLGFTGASRPTPAPASAPASLHATRRLTPGARSPPRSSPPARPGASCLHRPAGPLRHRAPCPCRAHPACPWTRPAVSGLHARVPTDDCTSSAPASLPAARPLTPSPPTRRARAARPLPPACPVAPRLQCPAGPQPDRTLRPRRPRALHLRADGRCRSAFKHARVTADAGNCLCICMPACRSAARALGAHSPRSPVALAPPARPVAPCLRRPAAHSLLAHAALAVSGQPPRSCTRPRCLWASRAASRATPASESWLSPGRSRPRPPPAPLARRARPLPLAR